MSLCKGPPSKYRAPSIWLLAVRSSIFAAMADVYFSDGLLPGWLSATPCFLPRGYLTCHALPLFGLYPFASLLGLCRLRRLSVGVQVVSCYLIVN
jgi:hypothetical protein